MSSASVIGFRPVVAKSFADDLRREELIKAASDPRPLTYNPFTKLATLKIKVKKPKAPRKPRAKKVAALV